MVNLINRVIRRRPPSAKHAKERLQLVLIHDRTDLAPGTLEALKDELIEVISRHVNIQAEAVRIDLKRDGREQRLVADIPLRPTRRRRG